MGVLFLTGSSAVFGFLFLHFLQAAVVRFLQQSSPSPSLRLVAAVAGDMKTWRTFVTVKSSNRVKDVPSQLRHL